MALDPTTGLEIGEEKVVFNEAQQALVNSLIQKKQGEAAKEVRTELAATKTQLEQLATELADAKTKLAAAGTSKEKKGAQEDIDAVKAQMEEMRNSHKTLQTELERIQQINQQKDKLVQDAKQEVVNVRKQNAIQAAAGKQAFFDVNDVLTQTQDAIKWDEGKGRFIVVGEAGQERMNASFEPMTLEEFYAEYATKKPYMVRGDVKGGSGSTEAGRSALSQNGQFEVKQIFGKGSNGMLANKLKMENPKEYARLKGVARSAGLIS